MMRDEKKKGVANPKINIAHMHMSTGTRKLETVIYKILYIKRKRNKNITLE